MTTRPTPRPPLRPTCRPSGCPRIHRRASYPPGGGGGETGGENVRPVGEHLGLRPILESANGQLQLVDSFFTRLRLRLFDQRDCPHRNPPSPWISYHSVTRQRPALSALSAISVR